MLRYQKFWYNDDCILDTKYKVVLYETDTEWKRYENWKSKYPHLENQIQKEKEALLKWNKGQPIEVDGVTEYYHQNGNLYKREYDDTKLEYNIDGILVKKIDKKSEIQYSSEFPYDVIYRLSKKNNLIIEDYIEGENNYKSILQKNNIKIITKKHFGKTLEKKIYVDNYLIKHTKYYTNTNSIATQIYKNYYTEYFTNKKLRAEGHLINDKPDGYWKFYHINGELESEHWFNDGRFESKSRSSIYFENAELNLNVKHD